MWSGRDELARKIVHWHCIIGEAINPVGLISSRAVTLIVGLFPAVRCAQTNTTIQNASGK